MTRFTIVVKLPAVLTGGAGVGKGVGKGVDKVVDEDVVNDVDLWKRFFLNFFVFF